MHKKLLVIFDLDETLIHASTRIPAEAADFASGPYGCLVCPNARELVASCVEKFDVGVWTSAGAGHANSVVEAVFGDSSLLRFLWSSERCIDWRDHETQELVSMKDHRKLRRQGIDLERVVSIDDSPEKHARNYGNLLRVTPWSGDPGDTELNDVAYYLDWLDSQPSVRRLEKRGWRNQSHWRPREPLPVEGP